VKTLWWKETAFNMELMGHVVTCEKHKKHMESTLKRYYEKCAASKKNLGVVGDKGIENSRGRWRDNYRPR
jgi:predicted  nucleic acid-binding Zn-ribbon protein